jgi:hypothetical protein
MNAANRPLFRDRDVLLGDGHFSTRQLEDFALRERFEKYTAVVRVKCWVNYP